MKKVTKLIGLIVCFSMILGILPAIGVSADATEFILFEETFDGEDSPASGEILHEWNGWNDNMAGSGKRITITEDPVSNKVMKIDREPGKAAASKSFECGNPTDGYIEFSMKFKPEVLSGRLQAFPFITEIDTRGSYKLVKIPTADGETTLNLATEFAFEKIWYTMRFVIDVKTGEADCYLGTGKINGEAKLEMGADCMTRLLYNKLEFRITSSDPHIFYVDDIMMKYIPGTEDLYIIDSVEEGEGDNLLVSVLKGSTATGGKVIVAVYEETGNMLDKVFIADAPGAEVPTAFNVVDIPLDGYELSQTAVIKTFIWDNFTNMTPLAIANSN